MKLFDIQSTWRIQVIHVLTVAMLALLVAPAAWAMKPHPRDGWTVDVGIGASMGRFSGEGFTDKIPADEWLRGYSPQWAVGYMLSPRFNLGFQYKGWLTENAAIEEIDKRYRRSMQAWSLGLTFFPGNPNTAAGGIQLRASGGIALGGLAELFLAGEDDPKHKPGEEIHQERIDETGYSFYFGGGYEIRIAEHFAAGFLVGYQFFVFDKTIFENGSHFPTTLHLSWYF